MKTDTNTEIKTERKVTELKKLNIFDVSKEVKEIASMECNRLNCDLVFICRQSTHPDDNFKYRVIGKKRNPLAEGMEFCTWLLNTSLGGFYEGKYDVSSFRAMELTVENLHDFSLR